MFPLLGVIISCLCFACWSLFRSLLSKSISLPTLTQQGYFISSKLLSWSEIINLIIVCPHCDNLRNFALLLAVINNILEPYQPPPRVYQDSYLVNTKKKEKKGEKSSEYRAFALRAFAKWMWPSRKHLLVPLLLPQPFPLGSLGAAAVWPTGSSKGPTHGDLPSLRK